jgi:hypothetical protein
MKLYACTLQKIMRTEYSIYIVIKKDEEQI